MIPRNRNRVEDIVIQRHAETWIYTSIKILPDFMSIYRTFHEGFLPPFPPITSQISH